jgi:tetratricopeptide (TPR) repeat protein
MINGSADGASGLTTDLEAPPDDAALAVDEPPAQPPGADLDDGDVAALAERLRAGRCILCAGARLHDGGGERHFRALVDRLLTTLPDDRAAEARQVLETRPLAAAGFVRRRLGDRFGDELRRAAAPATELPEPLLLLGELPFRAVVTTTYDDAFERAFVRDGEPPRIYTPRDAGALPPDGKARFVFKVLGDAARADTVVWSAEDLQAALSDGGYRALAHDLYRSRSFLFVGFDGRDPDLAILLERVLAGARADEVDHFAVLPGLTAVEKEELRAAYRIRVLDVDDVALLARALQAALAARPAAALPDEDDRDGWLALFADEPGRADVLAHLSALEERLRQHRQWEPLLELLLGRAAVEPAATARAALLVEVARVYEDELGDRARAFTVRLAALEERPCLAGWPDLERVADADDRWPELIAALTATVPSLPVDERALAWLRLAQRKHDVLDDAASALATVERALALAPDLDSAVELRVTLLRRLERWRALAAALDERARIAAPADARALALEAAALRVRIDDRAAAIASYEALAAVDARDLSVLRALERLYQVDGQTDRYVACLERQAEVAEPRERAALYRRMASLYEELPGHMARAQQCLERLIAVDGRCEDGFRALARLYRTDGKWEELIDLLRRHAAQAAPPVAAELYAEIAAVYEHELADATRAIDALLDVETALPNHAETMAALTRLYEQTGAWQKAADVLERRAQVAAVDADKRALIFRAGEIYAARLGDRRAAEARFVHALEIDPTHVSSMTALVEIYRQNGELLKAARLLVEAVAQTGNRLERTRLFVEAAELYDQLDDGAQAIACYLHALAVDPEHVEAGARVADLLWQAERHHELVPVLEMLTRKPTPSPLQLARLLRLARAAQAAGLDDKVGKAYTRAAELDANNLAALRGLADWYEARAQWPEALAALARIAEHHGRALAPEERVELWYRLGRGELARGDEIAAGAHLLRALALDPTHRPSLLARLELKHAPPEALIDAKKALLHTAGPDEKLKLLTEIGELCRQGLGDSARAVATWREALALRPDDHKLLHKCLDVHVEDRAWPQALELLEQLIAVEKVATVRAKYRHAAGLICRDELGRTADAAAQLSAALDDDPTLARSAKSLERLYRDRQEWKELARFYRKALKRLGPESPGDADGCNGERLRVWSALADVCQVQLGEPASALAALEVALVFDRDNLERHKRLADLYVQAGPDGFERAIVEHQYILGRQKNRVLSYRALKHLYIQMGQREKSVHVSHALMLLNKAEPDDHEKVARHRVTAELLATARRALGDEQWARLCHPDEDRRLDALFAIVGPMVAMAQAQPHKALGLGRKEALAVDDPRSFAKALRYISATLGTSGVEAYARPEQKEPVTFAACIERHELVPVFVLGAPLVGDKRPEREQVFELARRVAHLRPERLIRLVMPSAQQLGRVIAAAMAIGDDDGDDHGDVGKTVAALRRALPAAALADVAAIGRALRADEVQGEAAALAWLQATDLTALRAGYALAGDLEVCARLIAAEPPPATALPATQRLLDLVWSSVTEELFIVRKHLGLL